MITRSLLLCLQEITAQPQAQTCFLNPPCGCAHPGKQLECEECPHLEACLSRWQRSQLGQKFNRR